MYYNDVLLCYRVTADEWKQSYTNKFQKKYDTLVKSNYKNTACRFQTF